MNSINRADQILELIGTSHEGLSHADIHNQLNLPKSSLSRLLSSLIQLGYLSQDKKSRLYRLGPRLLTLAGKYLSGMDVFQVGRDYVTQLANMTDKSATLAAPLNQEAVLIAIENVPKSILQAPHIGDHLPMYATAAGKSILAHRSEREINQFFNEVQLKPITPHTITDPGVLREELSEIRNGAFAYSWQGFREHVVTVGAPVFNMDNKAIASLSVSVISMDAKPGLLRQIEKSLARVVRTFSRDLGYESAAI